MNCFFVGEMCKYGLIAKPLTAASAAKEHYLTGGKR
jgi:hypothetical protein